MGAQNAREVGLARAKVDVVGLGLNATDTVLTVRKFPPLGGKSEWWPSRCKPVDKLRPRSSPAAGWG